MERGIIAVTGASGIIGNAVLGRLSGQQEEVVGFDRESPKSPPPGCRHIRMDVTSGKSVRGRPRTVA